MLDQLHIKNFLTFDELLIPNLARVNLLAGKNNSGKTAILEAIRILVSEGDDTVVNDILRNRGAFKIGRIDSYDALFNYHILRNWKSNEDLPLIRINELTIEKVFGPSKIKDWYLRPARKAEIQADEMAEFYRFALNPSVSPEFPNDKLVYIPFFEISSLVKELWKNVVLKPEENNVIEILKTTIDANIERLTIVDDSIYFELSNMGNRVSIRSLGDGVKRILLVALGLVNSMNKILLIDEIELGLHHTVIEKLWKMIFKYAQLWNIQVFITTHSEDVIRKFCYTINETKNLGEGKFFRIQKGRTGKMEAIEFDQKRLQMSLEMDLEIR